MSVLSAFIVIRIKYTSTNRNCRIYFLFDFNQLVERKMSLLIEQVNTLTSKELTLFASLLLIIGRQIVTGNDDVS